MEEGRSAFKILIGKPTGKKLLGNPRRKWEDNIRMDIKEIGINTRNWVDSARIIGKPFVNAAHTHTYTHTHTDTQNTNKSGSDTGPQVLIYNQFCGRRLALHVVNCFASIIPVKNNQIFALKKHPLRIEWNKN